MPLKSSCPRFRRLNSFPAMQGGTRPPGEDALHAATGPVHGAGCLAARLGALHELLGRAWSRKEVEAAQVRAGRGRPAQCARGWKVVTGFSRMRVGLDCLSCKEADVHKLASSAHALCDCCNTANMCKPQTLPQSWGFFRRLVPLLGVAQLQGPAALLLARCAALLPPAPPAPGPPSPSGTPSPAASPPAPVTVASLLGPVTQELCAVLPLLLCSPKYETRQVRGRAAAGNEAHCRRALVLCHAFGTVLPGRHVGPRSAA